MYGKWWGVEKVGRRPRVSYDTQKLRDHMAYNFRIQLMKVCVSRRRGAGFRRRLRVKKKQNADWWAQLPIRSP